MRMLRIRILDKTKTNKKNTEGSKSMKARMAVEIIQGKILSLFVSDLDLNIIYFYDLIDLDLINILVSPCLHFLRMN